MQYVGFLLLGLTLVALAIGLVQRAKMKKILAAPFRKTGEIAQNPQLAADAKGAVSCQGNIVPASAYVAPCSGRPCVYWEVKLERSFTKTVMTERGAKTERGTESLFTKNGGAAFFVDDGTGPALVDSSKGMECELDKTFEQKQNVIAGDAVFGALQVSIPSPSNAIVSTGVTAIERIVPAEGSLFVLGKMDQGAITKLVSSRKGRDALLGKTQKISMGGFVAAAVMLLPGAGLSIFASPPAKSLACAEIVDETTASAPCRGKVTNDDGETAPVNVTQAGTYRIEAHAPSDVKIPFMPLLTVRDATGKTLATREPMEVELALTPGKYDVVLQDAVKGAPGHFKGGFSFEMTVKRVAIALPTTAASADGPATTATATAATAKTTTAAAHPGTAHAAPATTASAHPGTTPGAAPASSAAHGAPKGATHP